jgi:putative transposase
MEQMARNATDETSGCLRQRRYVLHDRDTKFCASFRSILSAGGVQALTLPPCSPNLNAFAERWVRSVKQECVSKLILFGEGSLKRALTEFTQHYHSERQSPRKAQRPSLPLSRRNRNCNEWVSSLQRKARRLTQILLPRRVSILTVRA